VLNGLNRTGQSTTVQLDAQGLAALDTGGIADDPLVDTGDRVAASEGGVWAERAEASRLRTQAIPGGHEARLRATPEALARMAGRGGGALHVFEDGGA